MKRIVLIAIFGIIAIASKAQTADSVLKSKADIKEDPSFPGGQKKLDRYLRKNIKYPKTDLEKGHQGIVLVQFIIEKNGSLTNFIIVEGVSKEIDEEALRVVKNSPNWEPAKRNGKPVRVKFVLPVRFWNETE